MIKVLFVCHGNICRSPMAEFILKDILKKRGIENKFYVESCATSTEALGLRVYSPARKILSEHGINCEGKTSRQMTREDYNKFDYIIAMDNNNLRNMKIFVGEDSEKKVSLLKDFTDTPGEVADPWYTDDFETTYREIVKGCEGIIEKVLRSA